jgi:hypothetical protein
MIRNLLAFIDLWKGTPVGRGDAAGNPKNCPAA